jgi:hypothetical protein
VKRVQWSVGALLAMGSLGVAGCSSSTTPTSSPTTSNPPRTTATATPTTAMNVTVTNQTRAELLAAGAAVNGIPVAEYTGLAPGLTFYALDRSTSTYWAGARLVPAPTADPSNPSRAQVASQDDGSYYIFTEPAGGSWTAHASGASGPQSPCPLSVPAAVVQVWGWPPGSCRPPNA